VGHDIRGEKFTCLSVVPIAIDQQVDAGAEANGLRFEVLEQGTGVRLALCLHGFPEHAISWRHQIPVLAGMGYRVWAVNQRGYGRTTRPTQVADYALPHLVDDVTARRSSKAIAARSSSCSTCAATPPLPRPPNPKRWLLTTIHFDINR
jgi:alpha-beta hydrolase superfamily lysophospholipase